MSRSAQQGRAPWGPPEAGVVASDGDLGARMVAALQADGLGATGAETLEGLIEPGAGATAPCDVIVIAAELRAAPACMRTIRGLVAEPVPLVLIARAAPPRLVRRALQAHVDGVVLAAELEQALAATTRAVLTHQVVVPRADRRQVLAEALSHREKQVLVMVAAGCTNAEIAQRCFVAQSTVKSHLSSAFAKLGVRSHSEAAALILDPEEVVGPAVLAAAPWRTDADEGVRLP